MSEQAANDEGKEVIVINSTRGYVKFIDGKKSHVIFPDEEHKHWIMPTEMLEEARVGESDFFILEQIRVSGEDEDTLRVVKEDGDEEEEKEWLPDEFYVGLTDDGE